MNRKTTGVALEREVQVADRADRAGGPDLRSRRAVGFAGLSTQERLTAVVFDRLQAMLEADGHVLDTATVYAAVAQTLWGVTRHGGDLATAVDDELTPPADTAGQSAMCAMFAGLGSICEELDLVQPALVAYRRSVQHSLQTNDPVAIGNARGRLVRLSTQQQRRVRAAAKDVAAEEWAYNERGR